MRYVNMKMRFGEVLKRVRLETRMTQRQLAEETGVSLGAIRALEQGHTYDPTWTVVQLLAAGLRVSTEELRTDDDGFC